MLVFIKVYIIDFTARENYAAMLSKLIKVMIINSNRQFMYEIICMCFGDQDTRITH